MFDELMDAFEKIGKNCHRKLGDGLPFFPTEYYSEGTMLKLVVAMLREVDVSKLSGIVADIARAARKGWLSEGEMRPAFFGEGPTSADGIVGDLAIQNGTEWGAAISDVDKPHFYVLEAKMGSSLSRNTKSTSGKGDEGFHQAARNISCIAGIACRAGVSVSDFDGRFYVLAPSAKSKGILEVVGNSVKVIERALEGTNERHLFRDREYASRELFMEHVQAIAARSTLVTWESVLSALDEFDCAGRIGKFYEICCEVNLSRSQLRAQ